MLGWFQALMPREDRFFDMFARQAVQIALAAETLRKLLEGGPQTAHYCAEIFRLENEADAITREVLLAVRRTFITPFDRGDITDLSNSLDDAIDQMQRTAKKILLFDVGAFEPEMREMAELIVESAKLGEKMVSLLPAMRDNSARLAALNVEMTRLEEQADELHDQGVKALYLRHRASDPMAFVVGSEIYDHLEKVVDRLEDVANRIGGIVIEHL